ncbi:hypothetical protein EVAR_51957_1 [Eumeta japonica]|uniref:Uncharacterized protein n=1 Tax=Eumeta variegata TaxID=151549 RepID=A0A4C1Y487_EUMVA|nr:hypothetical protein EVAR_51957_1 [Eumeta japonica]
MSTSRLGARARCAPRHGAAPAADAGTLRRLVCFGLGKAAQVDRRTASFGLVPPTCDGAIPLFQVRAPPTLAYYMLLLCI